MRPVRVMCSGMVHPELVVEAFRRGADGVVLMG
jgi:F420-non-reducing hydrogenase iron-sulfur subunit